MVTFGGHEKFGNSFQNSWLSLIASSISFNLIWGFRYLQFKPDALHHLDVRHL